MPATMKAKPAPRTSEITSWNRNGLDWVSACERVTLSRDDHGRWDAFIDGDYWGTEATLEDAMLRSEHTILEIDAMQAELYAA